MIETKTFFDPIALWRQSLDRLEGQANAAATGNMENERVARALSVAMNATVGAQNVFDKGLHKFYERLDIPARSELAAVAAAVQRVEDRLAELFPQAAPQARPARTRKPEAAGQPQATAADEAVAQPAAKRTRKARTVVAADADTGSATPARAKRARRTRP